MVTDLPERAEVPLRVAVKVTGLPTVGVELVTESVVEVVWPEEN